ncbi:hypothetical protein DEO72_LG1g2431 [Vigna unguiculata]|uniref:Uncharacterized protein n=1 Tax=Vigna unguiculata TaxID=3917 RepID=A0A4D6KQD3_VIGUN|nr:hypothetical protein DEO72_LG1g2431 [Vigna unguiculata]
MASTGFLAQASTSHLGETIGSSPGVFCAMCHLGDTFLFGSGVSSSGVNRGIHHKCKHPLNPTSLPFACLIVLCVVLLFCDDHQIIDVSRSERFSRSTGECSESVPRSCLCSTVWVLRFPASFVQLGGEQLGGEQRYPPQVQASVESDQVICIRMSRVVVYCLEGRNMLV